MAIMADRGSAGPSARVETGMSTSTLTRSASPRPSSVVRDRAVRTAPRIGTYTGTPSGLGSYTGTSTGTSTGVVGSYTGTPASTGSYVRTQR
jgi:hypothetical protein